MPDFEPTWLECKFWLLRQWAMHPYRQSPERCPRWRKTLYHFAGRWYRQGMSREAFKKKTGRI